VNKLSNITTRIQWNGDSAVTIFFEEEAGEALTRYILSLTQEFKATFSEIIIEAIPAYQSLTLCFDALAIDTDSIEASLQHVLDKRFTDTSNSVASSLIDIPVCYQAEYAPDLQCLAEYCKLGQDEVIQLHTQPHYLVSMLGFLPGFLYLSGLVDQLHCPRKEIPSLTVSAGAVGIGGNQTGVYPVDSPGGWHIIGHTPAPIFNPVAKQAFIAQPLDRIRFVPIDIETFEQLQREQT
jgi:KipI family sensor histidine kinase inhibitor